AAVGPARRLGRRHARRIAEPVRLVRPRAMRAIAGSVATAARGLGRRLEAGGDPVRAARLRLEQAEAAITAALPEAARGGDVALHRLRLRIKKARYALECLEAAVGVRFGLDRLRELQQVLGEIHDRATLIDEVRARIARAEARGAARR